MQNDLKLPFLDTPSALRRLRVWLLAVGLIALASLLTASGAQAADRVYWSNFGPVPSIAYANLDGSGGGGTVNTSGATLQGPHGSAIDAARGRIYWANWAGDTGTTISYANLDGSGGGDLDIQGATISGPHGLAIDPTVGVAGRLYWPNHADDSISYADLDGLGGGTGGDLAITDATVDSPRGLTIDPVGGRIYWSNYGDGDPLEVGDEPDVGEGTIISYASLDGSGDGDLLETNGLGPEGTAVDPLTRRIYWSDWGPPSPAEKRLIESANSDGTDVRFFNTTGASPRGVHGVTIDPDTRRLYWANYNGNSISWANLDGSGGQTLDTSGTTISSPVLPSLLKAPAGTSLPQISGGSDPGATLSCSAGTWAGDVLESLLYRAPQSVAYQWTLNGADLPGAETNSITATAEGNYRCRVTATNAAGSTPQTSPAHLVGEPPDTTPPNTTINSGPSGTTTNDDPSFAFSSEAGATFGCRLDGPGAATGTFGTCFSPKAYSGLADGPYTFRVRATDQASNADPTPASRSFTVDTNPPETLITKKPKGKIKTRKKSASSKVFFSSEPGATFMCKLDKAGFEPCSSPYRVKAGSKGGKGKQHKVSIQATDTAGNIGRPAVASFKVIRKR